METKELIELVRKLSERQVRNLLEEIAGMDLVETPLTHRDLEELLIEYEKEEQG